MCPQNDPGLPSPARVAQSSRLPEGMPTESPPFLTGEPDAADLSRSRRSSQSSLLDSRSRHDTHPQSSLPLSPEIPSRSFTSAPLPRPASLHRAIDNGPPASPSQLRSGGSHFPCPQPPRVMTPSPPPSSTGNMRTPAPYEVFLPRHPPSPDQTDITIEPSATAYRLMIQLQGFQRNFMCAMFLPHS